MNKKIALNIAPIAILILALSAGCGTNDGDNDGGEAVHGDPPMFTLADLDGDLVSLEAVLREKPVLLVFWATWCPPCVAEIPHLNRIAVDHGDNLAVISVNLQEERDHVAAFAVRRNIGYTVLLDPEAEVARQYAVRAVPTLIVIGRDGKAYYRGHSSAEAERVLGRVIDVD